MAHRCGARYEISNTLVHIHWCKYACPNEESICVDGAHKCDCGFEWRNVSPTWGTSPDSSCA